MSAQIITCPTTSRGPEDIVGCGSTNVHEFDPVDEPGVFDCLDCGIWFTPALEAEASRGGARDDA